MNPEKELKKLNKSLSRHYKGTRVKLSIEGEFDKVKPIIDWVTSRKRGCNIWTEFTK